MSAPGRKEPDTPRGIQPNRLNFSHKKTGPKGPVLFRSHAPRSGLDQGLRINRQAPHPHPRRCIDGIAHHRGTGDAGHGGPGRPGLSKRQQAHRPAVARAPRPRPGRAAGRRLALHRGLAAPAGHRRRTGHRHPAARTARHRRRWRWHCHRSYDHAHAGHARRGRQGLDRGTPGHRPAGAGTGVRHQCGRGGRRARHAAGAPARKAHGGTGARTAGRRRAGRRLHGPQG